MNQAITMRKSGWWTMTVLAAMISLYAFAFFLVPAFGAGEIKARFLAAPLAGYSHVLGGAVALLIGPFQFSARLRARRLSVHRWAGRVYLLAVLASGLAGLYLATVALGGPSARVGFGMLAVLWLFSGAMAYVSIRSGRRSQHRRWMMRNYALTYAAVMLRILIPSYAAAGYGFELSYPVIAWACWVPNLIFVEWVLIGRR